MRKLKGSDLFNTLRLIKKAQMKDELLPVIKQLTSGGMSAEDIGITGILTIIEILTEKKAEQGIWEMLAGPFEMKPEEVADLDLLDLAEKMEQLAKENDLKRFFTMLSGLMQTKQLT